MSEFGKKLRYYLFEKRYSKYDSKPFLRLIRKATFYLSIVYVPLASLVTITNNLVVEDDEYAAILLSGYAYSDYDYWASPLAFLGSYPAWTIYFNLKGIRTDYVFNATVDDLKNILVDPKYQSIVLVGHGSKNVWRATDRSVSNVEIMNWRPLFTPKKGEWIQLSCPTTDVYPEHLGELVMDDRSKVFHYSGEKVGNLEFVTDALTGFRLIKHQTRKRRVGSKSVVEAFD